VSSKFNPKSKSSKTVPVRLSPSEGVDTPSRRYASPVLLEDKDTKGLGSGEPLTLKEYGMRVSGGGAAFLYVLAVPMPAAGVVGSTVGLGGEGGILRESLGRS